MSVFQIFGAIAVFVGVAQIIEGISLARWKRISLLRVGSFTRWLIVGLSLIYIKRVELDMILKILTYSTILYGFIAIFYGIYARIRASNVGIKSDIGATHASWAIVAAFFGIYFAAAGAVVIVMSPT